MLGDLTALAGIVFGSFFYWTVQPDFPPDPSPGPGAVWPTLGAALLLAAWLLTLVARWSNRRASHGPFHGAAALALLLAVSGAVAFLAGPRLTGLDPTADSYGAVVWLLCGWMALHALLGGIMHLYCIARRAAGRLTPRHDIDIANVALYWHFVAIMAVVTAAVIAGFPLVA
jgi:cytochrome c oxidase subunit I+III